MPKIIAVIIEILVYVCVLWVISFLSTLLHELGHAAGYRLSTGGRHWHIRVGSGKKLFETESLTVKLFVFDGRFEPDVNRIDTMTKLILTLLGGPVASLVLVVALLLLRSGGVSFDSAFFASGTPEALVSYALFCNAFILVSSIIPARYLHGEIKGMETDGRQILNAIRSRKDT